MNSSCWKILIAIVLTGSLSCQKEDGMVGTISLFSATLNGSALGNSLQGIATDAEAVFVFSQAVDPTAFENAFSIQPNPANIAIAYANQASRVNINLTLEPATLYTMTIGNTAIGVNGEKLQSALTYSFTTKGDGTIFRQPPCTSANNDCLGTLRYGTDNSGVLEFYASYPIFEENAAWQDLKAAVIVVHGANRDADNYFSYMSTALAQEDLLGKVALIAPRFKNDSEASGEEFFWTNTGWRTGNNSLNRSNTSSFELVDALVEQLADTAHFPVLEKIIITGHSSGGLFTHLYGAANKAAEKHPDIQFEYVSANSQYFYYPGDERIDETSNELYIPSGCTGYNFYPLGYEIVPDYVAGTFSSAFNDQFIHRSITYLLGNGNTPDPTLNTSDCSATLLGSTRYKRGENMYRYMELKYPGVHNHKRILVEGIGHDGRAMYQSSEFRTFIRQQLN